MPRANPNQPERERPPKREPVAHHRFLRPRVREVVRNGQPVAPRRAGR